MNVHYRVIKFVIPAVAQSLVVSLETIRMDRTSLALLARREDQMLSW